MNNKLLIDDSDFPVMEVKPAERGLVNLEHKKQLE
jgi:hypothetical protein